MSIVALGLIAAATAAGPVVHPDGRIGVFRLDRTTEAQIRAVAGQPLEVETDFSPGKRGPIGRSLTYRCGGAGCRTIYSISNATGALSDFWTSSPRFRTPRGTHVGMTRAEAVRREGTRVRPGCGTGGYIYLRSDARRSFVLNVWGGRVRSMIYLGPHSVYYDGLC